MYYNIYYIEEAFVISGNVIIFFFNAPPLSGPLFDDISNSTNAEIALKLDTFRIK